MADLNAAIRAAEEFFGHYDTVVYGGGAVTGMCDTKEVRLLRALLDVAKGSAPAPLPPAVAEAAERLRRYAAGANCEMGDVETAESFAVRCAVRELLAALDAPAPLLAASRNALTVLAEIAESAAYWSDYDVPVGLVPRVDEARARLAAALEGGSR